MEKRIELVGGRLETGRSRLRPTRTPRSRRRLRRAAQEAQELPPHGRTLLVTLGLRIGVSEPVSRPYRPREIRARILRTGFETQTSPCTAEARARGRRM